MKKLQILTLVVATLTTGLMAGLTAGFAYAVMPGLSLGDDKTFVSAMQNINVAIVNGWFMSCFIGALLLTIAATALNWRRGRPALPWIIAGAVLYLVMVAITGTVNVPLNGELAAAGSTDPAAARAAFEGPWVAGNIARALAAIAAFGCLAWALVLHRGRSAE